MSTRRIKINFIVLAGLVALACAPAAAAKSSEKETTLRICSQLFSAPVDLKQNLFEVNPFYVLQAKFDKRGRLEELAVEPKHFFEESHPEWDEPVNFTYLSGVEYETLLALLDSVKPKGMLKKPKASISVITNLTAHHSEVYEHAVLEWGEIVDARRPDDAPLQVRYIRLKYLKSKLAS